MQFFSDQPLRSSPHLAVFSSNKVGNFVVTTPLLRGLKQKYPGCTLDFFGSDITQDFEQHCSYIDWRYSLHGHENLETVSQQIEKRYKIAGAYDLVINCDNYNEINRLMIMETDSVYVAGMFIEMESSESYCLNYDSRWRILKDNNWNDLEFVRRHFGVVNSNYIGEILCRIAYVDTNFFQLEVPSKAPSFSVPDILIHITATRPTKMWTVEHWQQVINWCTKQGLQVGLVGSSPKKQQMLYYSNYEEETLLKTTDLIDLRGKTSLTELAGAFRSCKACISVDSGPLHVAAAVGCPTVAIFGNDMQGEGPSPIRLWSPRLPNVEITVSAFTCTQCQEHRFKNKFCLLKEHHCMLSLPPQNVLRCLKLWLS